MRHEDQWCLHRGQHRQRQVEEDEGIGIEGVRCEEHGVQYRPEEDEHAEADDELPRAADGRDLVGESFAEGRAVLHVDAAMTGAGGSGAGNGEAPDAALDHRPLVRLEFARVHGEELLGERANRLVILHRLFLHAANRAGFQNRF